MTHDGSKDSNVGRMVEYLTNKNEGFTFAFLKKADRNLAKNINIFKGKLSFFVAKPYEMATSEYIMLDNVFLPMAYLKFHKKVKVIQLWHGTGTIKKFGQDVNIGMLKRLEKKANARLTHLIVNSKQTKEEYASAFGVSEDRIFIYGLPRTDIFFDPNKKEERIHKFYRQYPELKGKRLVLYAPTFRDQEKDRPRLLLDTELLCEKTTEDFVFLLRLHPFVEQAYRRTVQEKSGQKTDHVISMSSYPDINTLLLVSDYLISDYSSVIFEYCLLNRPIIFFAYDLKQFSNTDRGFYQPYEEFVPGPVVIDTQSVAELLNKNQFDIKIIENFKNKSYQFLDGKSAERLYLHIFCSSAKNG
jgi:CDP-ribitol ribitolphosphotransferase